VVSSRRTGAAALAAVSLLLSLPACAGGGHHPAAAPSTTGAVQHPVTTAPTTSTTVLGGPPFPLTGLPSGGSANIARPALSIKIDNAPSARPQAGLQLADVVTEELVEGGLTRFFATYQSQDAAKVGPVRSARLVDADLLTQLGGGVFAFAGAAAGVLGPVRARSGAVLVDDTTAPQAFYRAPGHPAPSNLYTSTAALYLAGSRPGMAAPPPLFTYSATAPAGAPTANMTLRFSSASVISWRALATGGYQRLQNGFPAVDEDGSPVTADNVVVLSVAVGHSGIYDAAHNESPLVIVTGTGAAWVLRDGTVSVGRWTRPDDASALALTAADGTTMALHPGRTWVELLPLPAAPSLG